HINVQEGERIRAGEPLMDGPLNPHDILAVLGEKELQAYLVNEIQEVYRLQGVNISDKHIEVIVRQMMRWVKVEDVGDTSFLLEQQIDKFRFREENEKAIANGGKPATGRPLLLGITKASLSTDSFISAASFQETTRVLTEASIQGAVDHLRGLKENRTREGAMILVAPSCSECVNFPFQSNAGVSFYAAVPATLSGRTVACLSARRVRCGQGSVLFRHLHLVSCGASGGLDPVGVAHHRDLHSRDWSCRGADSARRDKPSRPAILQRHQTSQCEDADHSGSHHSVDGIGHHDLVDGGLPQRLS